MRISGAWVGWGLGDNSSTDMTVKNVKAYMRAEYRSYAGILADTNLFDQQMQDVLTECQTRLVAGGHLTVGKYLVGVLDLPTEVAMGYRHPVPPEPVCVAFSINGAGSTWNMGYPYDVCETLDKSKCWHQPIGYNTNPFPMMTGVNDGVAELIRQLDMPRGARGLNCTILPWTAVAYSMGAIVFLIVLMRVLFGDLGRFKATYMGSSAFGPPMRQHGHTFPGCSYSDGEGIVTPNAHDTPEAHWDMAADKVMAGSPGDDLYCKLNKAGTTAEQLADMRAVWQIVATGNPLSLGMAVLMLAAHPTFSGGVAAAKAAFEALDFFVVKGVTPHTSYQFTHPIDGDNRDCWELVREHTADLVARLPIGAAV
jgi:hypothetical protein